MQTKQIDEVLKELKGLRKKVKKAAQAQANVDEKLAQLEALIKLVFQQNEPALDKSKKSKKAAKKESKKMKPANVVANESTDLADTIQPS